VNHDLHIDYTTVGHVTIDVLDDGSRRAGGSAFYSALQAARLGLRTLIVTRGVASEIEELIEPHRHELQLRVLPAPRTTTLLTAGSGPQRSQRMLAWAGPIAEDLALDTAILHLAPVARESPSRWRGRAEFVGLTPQGLAREWRSHDGQIELTQPAPSAAEVAARCDAVVVNEHEHASCADLIATATASGALVAITAGAGPTTILAPHRDPLTLDVPALDVPALDVPALGEPIDDLGAGDVFAAAFFIALRDGRSALDASAFANAAAAVRLRGSGAHAIGKLDAIEARLHATARA
jgi:1D-myo-inositol 3-kinase